MGAPKIATHLRLVPPAEPDPTSGFEPDPTVLVERACAGDVAAWGQIYAGRYPRLLRQLRHLTGDMAVAEELAQETFAQAMASRHRYEPGRCFDAWLSGIALNMARKHWRSRHNTDKAHAKLGTIAALTAGPAEPDRMHLQRERSRVLYAVLADLPESLREAFMVRELHGLATDEAADLLQISPNNLAVRVNRAKTRILAALRQRGWLPQPPAPPKELAP